MIYKFLVSFVKAGYVIHYKYTYPTLYFFLTMLAMVASERKNVLIIANAHTKHSSNVHFTYTPSSHEGAVDMNLQ